MPDNKKYEPGEELKPDWSDMPITDEKETGDPHEDEGDDK
jgi:hypothetical protein